KSRFADPIASASTRIPRPEAGCLPGIVADALIMTMRGACAIQDLRAGDRVITRGNGAVPVLQIEQQSVVARAVYVLASSLGHHRADRDTLLCAHQTVLVRDWRARVCAGVPEVLKYAGDLVDGEFVRDLGFQPMTLYRVFCAEPQVLYADGMELGSADSIPSVPKQNAVV
ncbi:MAG: Hint domain-containing protein, partial [Roseobacter sp.]